MGAAPRDARSLGCRLGNILSPIRGLSRDDLDCICALVVDGLSIQRLQRIVAEVRHHADPRRSFFRRLGLESLPIAMTARQPRLFRLFPVPLTLAAPAEEESPDTWLGSGILREMFDGTGLDGPYVIFADKESRILVTAPGNN